MGWLLFCPHHYLGIYGLIGLFVGVYYHPNIFNWFLKVYARLKVYLNTTKSYFILVLFLIFFLCCLYTLSYLPCGKYFTYVQGNKATTMAYLYVYIYWFIAIDLLIRKKGLSRFLKKNNMFFSINKNFINY